jgi:hypothetical protein
LAKSASSLKKKRSSSVLQLTNYFFIWTACIKSDAVALSYFKLIAFLEGYHRDLIEKENRSPKAKLNELFFQSILASLKQADMQEADNKSC